MNILCKVMLFLILTMSIVSLVACADENTEISDSSTDVSVTDSVSPTPSNTGNLITIEDIESELKQEFPGTEVEIIGTSEVGTDYLLVEFELKTSTNAFRLYNLKTGFSDALLVQDVILKNAVSENYFIFEDRGEFTDTALRCFPSIVRCFRISNENERYENFKAIYEDEYFELDRSVEAGHSGKTECVLSAIAVTFDGIEGIFKPVDSVEGMGEFYCASSFTPPITTSYDSNSNQFTIEIEANHLGDDLVAGTEISAEDNAYISSYEIEQEGNMIYIRLTLRSNVEMYQIGTSKVQFGDDLDGFPYFYFNLISEEQVNNLNLDY